MDELPGRVVELPDEAATAALAVRLADVLRRSRMIWLEGDLGAGKSAFARAFIRHLGYSGHVKSPTYTIVETYEVGDFRVAHMDLYRFEDPEEWYHAGLDDVVERSDATLVEWPAMGGDFVPRPDLVLKLAMKGEGRIATLSSPRESLAKAIEEALR